jgi:uncharacterized protein YraI
MRPALFAGLVVAVVPAVGYAQAGPHLATVTDPEVKLRAGPSDAFPETATLAKGSTLLVDHEEPNGWLAVQDAPGTGHSLSWVQAQFVDFDNTKPVPQRVMVSETTTLRAGQMGLAQPLHIRRTEVPAGTILRVIGAKVQFEGKTWHPVEPPAGDFRYLPKTAVRFEKPANTTFAVRDSIPVPPAVSPAGGPAPVAAVPGPGSATLPPTAVGKPGVQHALWKQAEDAERDGKYDEAERLFFQLAGLMNQPGGDHDIANLCYTRIHTLREKKRNTATATSSATRPPVSEPARPTGTGSPPPSGGARDDRAGWTGPGTLVRSNLTIAGPRSYRLESGAGVLMVYVVPAQGVDLERYVGKSISVYGASYTRSGLSKPYIVASGVEPAK